MICQNLGKFLVSSAENPSVILEVCHVTVFSGYAENVLRREKMFFHREQMSLFVANSLSQCIHS